MIGKYDIEVYNNRVHFFLTVKRNLTILQGNSAYLAFDINSMNTRYFLRCFLNK